jgi:hypothetical protein
VSLADGDRERLSIRVSIALRSRLKVSCAHLGVTQQDAVLAGLRLWGAKVGMPVLDLPDYRGVRPEEPEPPTEEEP